MKKLIISALVAAQIMCLSQTAMAAPEDSLSEAKENLNETNSKIRALNEKQEGLQREANELDSELTAILIEIETTKSDIEDKTNELEKAKEKLKKAEDDVENHKDSMATRVCYLYENGDMGFLSTILSGGSFAEVINRAEFTNSLYKEDRELLDEYTDAKDKADRARANVETVKKDLEDLEATLEEEQGELEDELTSKRAEIGDVSWELESLEALAHEYQGTITELNEAIEAENALEVVETPAIEIVTTPPAVMEEVTEVANQDTESGDENNGEGEEGEYTEPYVSSTGQAVADYACQFVGNPYVWGGTSLTNGCDCSGFIMSVYAQFGVSLPHYSGSLRSVGYEVSESELAPGDILCFSGHCAIYIGNNQMVHAQSAKTGIVISDYPYHKATLARRRIF